MTPLSRTIEIKDTTRNPATTGSAEGDAAALLQQFQQFSRERGLPRALFAEGAGAFGTFTATHDVTRFSCAAPFSAIGRETMVLMRFSSIGPSDGTMPDLRGVSVRFFTDQGNWDLVGANAPVFFLRDPDAFTAMAHTQLPQRATGLVDPHAQWDFWSRHPESLHLLTMLFSDRGRPLTHRFMHGYGVHTHSLLDGRGERTWCKFHLLTQQGTRMLDDGGRHDASAARLDLAEAITRREYPRWTLCVQLMTGEQARALRVNPFDSTTIWSHTQFPLQRIGVVELNRLPTDFTAEIEQVAFKPGAWIPGIGGSPDPLLRARTLAYGDAQTHRLGAMHAELPVNQSRCPVMRLLGGASAPAAPTSSDARGDAGWRLAQDIVERFRAAADHDDHAQPRNLYRMLDAAHRDRIARRIAASLATTHADVQLRQLREFMRVDADYGTRVARRLGIELEVSTERDAVAGAREAAAAAATMTCGAD